MDRCLHGRSHLSLNTLNILGLAIFALDEVRIIIGLTTALSLNSLHIDVAIFDDFVLSGRDVVLRLMGFGRSVSETAGQTPEQTAE